jgi:transposase
MSARKYRTYPEEFKLEALELFKNSGKSAGQIERELGITPGLLVKWKARFQAIENGVKEMNLEPTDLEAAKREIKRLKRKLAEVEEEREILKKAVNIFSRKNE